VGTGQRTEGRSAQSGQNTQKKNNTVLRVVPIKRLLIFFYEKKIEKQTTSKEKVNIYRIWCQMRVGVTAVRVVER